MTSDITGLLYLLAATLFIFAIKGLATPESARRGNIIGMVGMAVAIITTIMLSPSNRLPLILIAIAIGGAIGVFVAYKVKMTAMPQLVGMFNSLGGLAAVPVSASALYLPEAYGITDANLTISLIEIAAGGIIGAITFTGSIVAFAKLQGILSSGSIRLKGHHIINIALGATIILIMAIFCATESKFLFWI